MADFISRNKVYLLPLLALLLINAIYFFPVISGKTIEQDDILLGLAKSKEMRDYREANGDEPLWTNAMFSGMPTFQMGTKYPNNIYYYAQVSITKLLNMGSSSSIYIIASCLIAFYAFMLSFKVKPWIAALGAFMFAYTGFFIISFAAGHNLKVLVAGYSVPMIMGMLMAYKGKKWLGALYVAFFLGWSVYANHFQITFYMLFIILSIAIVYLVDAIKKGTLADYAKTSGILLIAGLIGFAPNIGNLWSTYTYAKETIRGGSSELAEKKDNEGLDYGYSMSWSYSPTEMLGLFVPQVAGGGAKESYEGTETFEQLKRNLQRQVPKNQLDDVTNRYVGSIMYWGEESLVNGSYYVGAILLFLFVFAIVTIEGPTRNWAIASVVLSIMLALGRHLSWFAEFMFNNFPLYNKFRVPSMALVISFIVIPFFGLLGLDRFFKKELSSDEYKKKLLLTLYITGGLMLAMLLLGTTLFSFTGLQDDSFAQNGFDIDLIRDDRISLYRTSVIKTLALTLLTFGAMWLYNRGQLKYQWALGFIAIFMVGDLYLFDRDQLGSSDFKSKKEIQSSFTASAADRQILQDPDPHYRVFNSQASLASDSYTSYFHKSVGGYHGAKLQRYQDLIEKQLSQGNMDVFSMLNTKYIIQKGQNGLVAVQNPNNLGDAWFIDRVKWVKNADDEINGLSDFSPSEEVIIDERFRSYVSSLSPDNKSSTITHTQYDPKHMVYEANVLNPNGSFAVFSELYYAPKNQEWNAYLDGEKVEHIRVNYLLRGMLIPNGKHTIEFKFEPKTYLMGETIDLTASIILLLALAAMIYSLNRKQGKAQKEA